MSGLVLSLAGTFGMNVVVEYDPEFGMGEDMFKDLALSKEMMRECHDKLPLDSDGRNLTVMVLQRSAWPFSVPKTGIDLPPNVRILFRLSKRCVVHNFEYRCKAICLCSRTITRRSMPSM